MKRSIRKLVPLIAAAMTLLALASSPASAATSADINSFDQLEVNATSGVNNYINVYPTSVANYYEVVDSADTVSPGAGCVSNSANSVTCGPILDAVTVWASDGNDYVSAYFTTQQFVAYAGEGNDTVNGAGAASNFLYGENGDDTLTGGGAYDAILGGPGVDTLNGQGGDDYLWGQLGNDTLNGGSGVDSLSGDEDNDTLSGGDGSDSISGDAGNDTLSGGNDEDTLRGGTGADVISGDAGTDTATYSEKTNVMVIRLDGFANDGETGENDNVQTSVENVTGGSAGDSIYGQSTTVNNVFIGGGGSDLLSGNNGSDVLTGGLGWDNLIGGNGNDTLNAKDGGSDTINCGADTDVANADLSPFDGSVSFCETINRS